MSEIGEVSSLGAPQKMSPELERWTRLALGDELFDQLGSKPLIAVALAAQRRKAAQPTVAISEDRLNEWVMLIRSIERDLAASRKALLAAAAETNYAAGIQALIASESASKDASA